MSADLDGSSRWFPVVSLDLYDGGPPDSSAGPCARLARELLLLGSEEPAWGERLLGWRRGGEVGVARLLRLHRLGMAAESASLWERADFYWRELRSGLRRLWRKSAPWEQVFAGLRQRGGAACEGTATEMRDRLLQEVFLDTHWAFYEGLSKGGEKPSADGRAFVHVGAIEELLGYSPWPAARQQEAFGALLEARVRASLASGARDQAVDLATRLAGRFPGVFEYEELLVEAELDRTLGAIRNGPGERGSRADAEALGRGIGRLELLLARYPHNAGLYDSLGMVEHLHAVKLANGGQPAEGLLAVEKSLTYRPGSKEVFEARAQLRGLMTSLQQRMQEVERAVARRANAQLNAQGLHMRAQARTGTSLADSYRTSRAAGSVAAALPVAAARTLWRQIGLSAPAAQWDERSLSLRQALGSMSVREPYDEAAIAGAWRDAISRHPDLADLDAERICAFVRRRLLGGDAPKAAVPATAPPPLVVLPRQGGPGSEPFADWLASRGGLALRILTGAAVALLAIAAVLTGRDAFHEHALDRSWNELQQAAERQDDLGVVQAAESYLQAPPAAAADPERRAAVLAAYSRSLVQWFVRLPGIPDAAALRHVERYRSLAAAGDAKGGGS